MFADDSGVAVGATLIAGQTDVNVRFLVAEHPLASVTRNVKGVAVTVVVGMPAMKPSVEKLRPAGKLPEIIVQLYSVTPLIAMRAVL